VVLAGPLKDVTEKQYNDLFDVNVKGVAFLLRNAANTVEEGGRIITIGSAVHRGWLNAAAYAGTKAAIAAIASSLALELAPKKITVNTIHPGYVMTDILSFMPESALPEIAKSIPFGRLGAPGDIGDVVSLFASEQARWITGQGIVVAGGQKD